MALSTQSRELLDEVMERNWPARDFRGAVHGAVRPDVQRHANAARRKQDGLRLKTLAPLEVI
jgi:hypothetical protein